MAAPRRAAALLFAALLSLASLAASAAADTTAPEVVVGQAASTDVPNSTLRGPGAFHGPVHQLPVDGIKIGYRQFGSGLDLIMVMGDTGHHEHWTLYLLQPAGQHST